VPPVSTHHVLEFDQAGNVSGVREVRELMQWENGGYFVLRQGIFDALREGEEMVPHAFARLLDAGALTALRYTGFWRAADTFKDRVELEEMFRRGQCPWMLWNRKRRASSRIPAANAQSANGGRAAGASPTPNLTPVAG
jgi:glucose-1-phosphate cytidylyltransferase